jgi:hypothetical protein
MQALYKEHFTQAQKQLLLGDTLKAKELLEPFISIPSKRVMIGLLLRQNSNFLEFLKAVSQKEYEKIDTLLKKYPDFASIPSYHTLQEEISRALQELRSLIEAGKSQEAQTLLNRLQAIPWIQKEQLVLSNFLQEAKKLLHYYDKNDFKSCYEIVDKSEYLSSMQLTKLLERYWSRLMQECELYGLQGDIKAIREALGELLYISTRRAKVGDLLRLSFYSKIDKELFISNFHTAENLIYSYIDIFGKDSEIEQIMQNFEKTSGIKLAITSTKQSSKSRNSWVYSEFFYNKN